MGARPPWPVRKQLRLSGFDYRADGPYFVTVCTKDRRWILGAVRDGVMVPSPAGEVVQREWLALPERFPSLILDEFTLMPNHIHGVVAFPTDDFSNPTLGRVVGALKSKAAIGMGPILGIRPGLVWQRGYHDHIIPNNRALDAIREYIRDNPRNWDKDTLRGTV
jgi:REP element-mobilizing transposase RayT